jgi:hypothetical protein
MKIVPESRRRTLGILLLLELLPQHAHERGFHLAFLRDFALFVWISGNSLIKRKLGLSKAQHIFFNRSSRYEFDNFYISLLTNTVSAVLRLPIIVWVEILIKPM